MDFSTGYLKRFLRPTLDHWLIRSNVSVYGSGRAAIIDIVKLYVKKGYTNLWMPAWQCSELVIALKLATPIKIKFYEIGAEDLVPTAAALDKMNSETDILLVVDYFASLQDAAFSRTTDRFSGPFIFDAVHSWLQSELASSLPKHVTIVSGFRKLFWKIVGAVVTGGVSQELSCLPGIVTEAAPSFPRNASLSPRFGFLSKPVLSILNLKMLDSISTSWPSDGRRGRFSVLKSPVKLQAKANTDKFLGNDCHWPDLYTDLPADLRSHAEEFKAKFLIVKR